MSKNIALKLSISVVGLALALVTALQTPTSRVQITPNVLVLLGFALIPWLSDLIESAELPGGWKVQFREVRVEQDRQRAEIEALKFLVAGFVTRHELKHLEKLATDQDFPFVQGPETSFFTDELRRLRALGLITGQPNKGIRSMINEGGDVKQHFRITDRGFEYLKLRQEVEASDA